MPRGRKSKSETLPENVALWFPVLCALSDSALQEIASMDEFAARGGWREFVYSQSSLIESIAAINSARLLLALRQVGEFETLRQQLAARKS